MPTIRKTYVKKDGTISQYTYNYVNHIPKDRSLDFKIKVKNDVDEAYKLLGTKYASVQAVLNDVAAQYNVSESTIRRYINDVKMHLISPNWKPTEAYKAYIQEQIKKQTIFPVFIPFGVNLQLIEG